MRQMVTDIMVTLSCLGMMAVHIGGCYLLLGRTAAIIYGTCQVLLAVWVAYALIRAPAYDD